MGAVATFTIVLYSTVHTYLVPEHHIHHLKNDIYLLSLIVMNIFLIHIGYVWLLFLVDLCICFCYIWYKRGKRDRELQKNNIM